MSYLVVSLLFSFSVWLGSLIRFRYRGFYGRRRLWDNKQIVVVVKPPGSEVIAHGQILRLTGDIV